MNKTNTTNKYQRTGTSTNANHTNATSTRFSENTASSLPPIISGDVDGRAAGTSHAWRNLNINAFSSANTAVSDTTKKRKRDDNQEPNESAHYEAFSRQESDAVNRAISDELTPPVLPLDEFSNHFFQMPPINPNSVNLPASSIFFTRMDSLATTSHAPNDSTIDTTIQQFEGLTARSPVRSEEQGQESTLPENFQTENFSIDDLLLANIREE